MGQAALALITSGHQMRGARRSLCTGDRAPWPEDNTGLEFDWCLARHQAAECSAARPKQGGDGSALGPAILGKMAVPVHTDVWLGPETTKPVS